MVGGGVSGKDAGIAHRTIAQVGATIMVFHLFMEEYLQDGEMIIETIVGKAENGIINEYLTDNFKRTGKGIFVSNLEEDLNIHMKDMKGEDNLNAVKDCDGLIPQSKLRSNIPISLLFLNIGIMNGKVSP